MNITFCLNVAKLHMLMVTKARADFLFRFAGKK